MTQSTRPPSSSPASGHASGRDSARGYMPFFNHLDELRVRLIRCLWVFFAGFGVCFWKAEIFLGFLRKPLFSVLPPDQQKLYFTSLFENFMVHLKISAVASIFFFSPFFFYQLWLFISPGLYSRERRMVLPFVSAASAFFVGGAAFAYYVLFPVGFKYFVQFGSPTDIPLLTIESYYTTCLKLMLLFGLAFELPVLLSLLGAIGVVNAPLLRQQRRNAIIGITVLAALFAPPDAISMVILGVPLILMYEGAILMVQYFDARRARDAANGTPLSGPPAETRRFGGASEPL